MTSSLQDLIGQDLVWTPTALNNHYDLIAPDTTKQAHLDMSSWVSKAKATVPEGTLFLQKNRFSTKVSISPDEQGSPLATYQRRWAGGQLDLSNGHVFEWDRTALLSHGRVWTNAEHTTTYAQFSRAGFSRKVDVVLSPQAAEISELSELSLLLVLGLYNILIERRRRVRAIAAASV
jgi:hypothetical protein